ncbi:phytanoyl-CoA dioxygenase family protein [Mesorhizobium yinganensis]|uniref:phytanoyl-CoA dioxygenase family protein n=1 Tax=Mesorhizobium yinganensis TaxID=3157707 RepID=UPI0032B7368F
MDKLLIDARIDSVRLEQSAALDLEYNIDSYLPPSWTTRQMVNGYKRYILAGNTENEDYLTLRAGFSETEGRCNKIFSDVIASYIRKETYDYSATMFPRHDLKTPAAKRPPDAEYWDSIRRTALHHLKNNGYWVAKFDAPQRLVESLKSKVMGKFEADHGAAKLQASIEGTAGAVRQFKSKSSWLLTFEEMYELAADPVLLSIMQSYMGVPPIFNTPVSFLNSAAKAKTEKDLSDTAQLYHHDMHRLSFVKLFVYLTDVGPGSGPHTLIPGTHQDRPSSLWKDRRHKDEDVAKAGLLEKEVRITGKAGTLFLVDTRALHKGAEPESEWRLMAQVQYTNSLFGYPLHDSDHKLALAAASDNPDIQQAAALVRKYVEKTGVRFMQNYI